MSDLGSTNATGVNVTGATSTNVNIEIPVSIEYSAAFKGTTPETNIETQNPGLENEVKTHEKIHVDQITAAANLPVTVTIDINGKATPFTGTADQVIVNATSAFNGSDEAKGMTTAQKGNFVNSSIGIPAITAVSNNIDKNVTNNPNVETDAVNKTNAKLGSSAKYSNGSTPVKFKGKPLTNDQQ
ncbi:hypothetical protein [Mucilaginibacter dorajii]|nr:hypothetical protein [Mucilaginibacter dorajii]MCS3736387.1 hypothetical protein [Mucilaginibacter dorajii]